MNRYDFTETGGFPLDQGVMLFLQDCINNAAQVASLAGPLAILNGCVVTGGSASDGVVVINGEILPFQGGVITPKIIIYETDTPLVFEDGTPRVVKFERYAKFGDDGVTTILWSAFKRNTNEGVLARLERLEMIAAPDLIAGATVRIWMRPAGDIPTGWEPLPDASPLRGRFALGMTTTGDPDFSVLGTNAGIKTKTLSVSEMPVHGHTISTSDSPSSTADGADPVRGSSGGSVNTRGGDGPGKTIGQTGGGSAFNIMPLYTIVDYIHFVGI